MTQNKKGRAKHMWVCVDGTERKERERKREIDEIARERGIQIDRQTGRKTDDSVYGHLNNM